MGKIWNCRNLQFVEIHEDLNSLKTGLRKAELKAVLRRMSTTIERLPNSRFIVRADEKGDWRVTSSDRERYDKIVDRYAEHVSGGLTSIARDLPFACEGDCFCIVQRTPNCQSDASRMTPCARKEVVAAQIEDFTHINIHSVSIFPFDFQRLLLLTHLYISCDNIHNLSFGCRMRKSWNACTSDRVCAYSPST